MKFSHQMTYDAPPTEVRAMLADPAFREKVCAAMKATRHDVSVEESGSGMTVLVDQTQPANGIPSFAKKFVGDEIQIVQREEWGGATDGVGDLLVVAHRQPPVLQHPQERVPEARLVQASLQPGPLVVGEPAEALHERRVLGAGEELQLAELHRLEPAGRGERLPEREEVLRGHRLQHVDLLDEGPLDDVHPVQEVLGPPHPGPRAAEHRVAGRRGLVQQLLEPQLVDLVDGDEQELVVRLRHRLEVLGGQQPLELEVAAVGQPGSVLAEGDVLAAPPSRHVVAAVGLLV